MSRPTFLEFFAGAGLVREALKDTWRCVWANDIDAAKQRIYTSNFGSAELRPGDVNEVDAASLPSADMAWASFPCQDLSLAGWRRGMSGRRSGSFWAFWRLMRQLHTEGRRPPLIVLENVPGLLCGDDFAGLCEALSMLDMRFGAMLLDARWFLPQSRPRVFVVAVDVRCPLAGLTQDEPDGPHLTRSVVAAWRRLPASLRHSWLWWRFGMPCRVPGGVEAIIEEAPEGVDWHSAEQTERLLGLMSDNHRARVEEIRRAAPHRRIGFLYKRTRNGVQRAEVRFDGIAGCLRTPGGGSSRQTLVVVHRDRVRTRLLSPRETARFMGVPDSFRLPDRYNEAYQAMGDGVAVPVVSALNRGILLPAIDLAKSGSLTVTSLSE